MTKLRIKAETRKVIALYLLLLPTVFLYVLFFIYPVINGLSFGLYQWSGVSPVKTFIGLKNYFSIVVDPQFHVALRNTFVITGVNAVSQFIFGFSLAWLARKYQRVGGIFLSIALIPIILSFVSVGVMWTWIYNPSFGLLNSLLDFLGLHSLTRAWLSNQSTALLSVLVTANWHGVGLYAIIYSAGLRTISPSIYDSMKVDGLSDLQKIRHVVIPMTKAALALSLVITISASFKTFELVYVLTGGGPGRLTDVIALYLYRYAFTFWKAGYASAVALYLIVMGLSLVIIQLKLLHTDR
ncbi:sugar ABC transporter permease [Candidatus Bathyarchaeota archaeon]|nr:sugar ABC transporter permease [Candidatus Bathyarchaeota archaeon]